ncbi:uncharacterized protein AB675_6241 [Cyphellophora attinorum]|uniref:Uncharacterized protein n=1 Tax=Cyphellophora attinorum TaxID=1664694 RepID=A0A0N1HEK1_9EURO|nr:uncharacterized protein AB675_6241 [Phialophora attinorum]KPI43876.1 hypothetical protein AB675_6241 [Phialophora attinorum]
MASGGGFNYKPNVNRNVTQKWRNAARPNYDDDDEWGDDGYGDYNDPPPIPPQAPSRPGWGNQMPPPSRSFTNPSPPRSIGRPSFDRGDDRRHVSSGGGFDSAYPTAQRSPFPEPQHEPPPPQQRYYAQPPLHINTHGQGPYPHPNARPGSRGSQRTGYSDGPYSAPGPYGQPRSHSGHRPPGPPPVGYSQRQGSPARPDSRSSNHSNRMPPPRKSSLSQERAPLPTWTGPPPPLEPEEDNSATVPQSTEPVKPLPFIRPSDIYKRMEEERQRERQSMDSSRPSLELDTTRSHDSAVTARTGGSENKQPANDGDTDSARRLRTNLDPVPERKSEYGMDNMLKTPEAVDAQTQSEGVHRNGTTASSVYTDRPDPVSASTENEEPSSAFSYEPSLPTLGRLSVFNPQLDRDVSAADAMPDTRSATDVAPANQDVSLDHKPSFGYRSVVQQAFDSSQKPDPTSPTSTGETIPRSNSASTSDLSPIVTRKHDSASQGQATTEPTIPEEPSSVSSDRPLSASTIKGADSTAPLASVVTPGYRRDQTPPSSGSPARRADVRHSGEVQPQQGVLSRINTTEQEPEATDRGRPVPPGLGGIISPSASQASGVSEEFNRWQAHSQQFNERLGNGRNSPAPTGSPISRAESPPKGTVKGLAGKYESNSGRSTPVNSTAEEEHFTRPAQARLESFRPVLPGAWQSYTATPALGTPQNEIPKPSLPVRLAPKDFSRGTAQTAWAAAAAAGTALAGSFNGPAFSTRHPETSEDESENEWDQSSDSSKEPAEAHDVRTRDFAAPQPRSVSPLPTEKSGAATTSADGHRNISSTSDDRKYIPAPLRMSKSLEPGGGAYASTDTSSSNDEDVGHGHNEKLQEDIVKSLTPRSSNIEDQATAPATSGVNIGSSSHVPDGTRGHGLQESEDMYGGQSAQLTPSVDAPRPEMSASAHQPQVSVSSLDSPPQRPFLEQRFSWEMGQADDKHADIVEAIEPSTLAVPLGKAATKDHVDDVKDPQDSRTSGVTAATAAGIGVVGAIGAAGALGGAARTKSSRSSSFFKDNQTTPSIEAAGPAVVSGNSDKGSFPPAPTSPSQIKSFQNIMKMGNQQDRIKALEDNRFAYGQNDGKLDQWIQSLQSPEYTDIFQSNGRISKPSGASNGQSGPQRLPSNRPLGNISGGRVMQEDGKKLMAAAGRFGGKAGVAAKGLFAKGKDKLRAASASEKGSQDNRKSSGSMPTIDDDPARNPRSSTALVPPQLPASDMVLSPMDESKWFAFDEQGGAKSQGPIAGQLDRDTPTGQLAAEAVNASPAERDLHKLSSSSSQEQHHSVANLPAVLIGSVDSSASQSEKPHHGSQALKEDDTAVQEPSHVHQRNVSDLTPDEQARSQLLDTREELRPTERLAVGVERQSSVVSAVSSASHSPAVSNGDAAHRSVSPAVHDSVQVEAAPDYEETHKPPTTTIDTKDEEAARDRGANADSHDPVPQYEETPVDQNRLPRIGPDAQILPVADLGTRQRPEPTVTNRPFSFEGSEALRQAQEAYVRDQQATPGQSQPMSPVSQTASKTMSQVSQEEIPESREPAPNRQSKSYSRPFVAANLGQHPAFRQDDQSRGRGQTETSGAPIAGPQNLQDEAAKYSEQLRPNAEEGYRIPGPYGQEYRSPKPKTSTPSPTAPQQRGQNPLTSPVTKTSSYEDYGDKHFAPVKSEEPRIMSLLLQSTSSHDQLSAALVPSSAPNPSKGLHDGKALTWTSTECLRDVPDSSRATVDRIATLRSQAAMASPEMLSRDYSGGAYAQQQQRPQQQYQTTDQYSNDRPVDATNKKKKRFSAMGNLFSSKNDRPDRTSTPQRSTTLPPNSTQPNRDGPQGQYQGQPRPYQHVSGYQDQNRDQQPQSYGNASTQQYPQPYQNYTGPHQHESRPSDLRIDTSNGQSGRPYNQPATAPPQTYAPRDISYGSNANNAHQQSSAPGSAYNLVTSPIPVPSTRAPATAAANTSSTKSNIDAHVINLHKRSRSPASEERFRRSQQLAPPEPDEDANSPAGGLGTFMNKKYSPVDGVPRAAGEQEKPWRIGIPGLTSEEEERRRSKQVLIEQGDRGRGVGGPVGGGNMGQQNMTVAERMMAPSNAAGQSSGGALWRNGNSGNRNNGVVSPIAEPVKPSPMLTGGGSPDRNAIGSRDGRKGYVAELPGSKAEGYESEEEVTMSATVRPGDWDWNMPVFVDDTK